MIQKFDKWHKTRMGLLFFALVEFAIAYGFMSLSIDRGNFFWYLLTLVFFVGALQNLIKLIGSFFHAKKSSRR
jgi:hypothetical protein